MIELTEEQQRQMRDSGWPALAVNPETQERFVLIHAELFERVRALLEEQDEIPAIEEMSRLASEVLDGEDSVSRESA